MALHITKAAESIQVSQLVVCLYGAPGFGKTSLAFTAERPLLLDFDGGVHRSGNRGDAVRVQSWKDVATMDPATDLADYKTVIVDTAGRALDQLSAVLIKDDPKNGTRAGALSLQGYGALKTAFTQWLSRLKTGGLDVVLLAHMDEQRKGDELIERIDVQGGSKNEIYKSADAMGRLLIVNGARVLNFSPSDVAYGKNPGRLEPLPVPSFAGGANGTFLADVIKQIKDTLNAESNAAKAQRELLDAKRREFEALDDPDKFTAEAVALAGANADAVIKRLLLDAAKAKGYVFDKEASAFIVAEKAEQVA
jgi:hypothetical protein